MLIPDLSSQASEFINGLAVDRQKQIAKKIQLLLADPKAGDTIQLQGYPFFRTRCGDYRIVHENDGTILQVLLIESRHDDEVYKLLKKMFG